MRKTGKLKSTPPVKPVQKVEVPVKITKWKVLLVAALLVVGVALIAYSVAQMLTVPAGRQLIQAPDGLENTCIYDFQLWYHLGKTEEKTNKEKTAVTEVYVKAAGEAYGLFSDNEVAGYQNIYTINNNPGKTIEVKPALYEAFRLLQESGSRALYLGPAYENNRALISSLSDDEANMHDPRTNAEVRRHYEILTGFSASSDDVELELLGNNQVRLNISKEYKAFAEECAIDRFISLDWMRNAFVTDYIADALINAGYPNGTLESYDGFTRYMDVTTESHDFLVCDGSVNHQVAKLRFADVKAVVWLRNYPISTAEKTDFYDWSDDRLTNSRLDPADGLDKAACDDFVAYSCKYGCAGVLMQTMDLYVADTLDWTQVQALPKANVEYAIVWDQVLYVSGGSASVMNADYQVVKGSVPAQNGGKEE